MEKYKNRSEAGDVLGHRLKKYQDKKNVLILALPRGGVPVAYEMAHVLHLPLDVFVVRKLGVPGHPELEMGAITNDNTFIYNTDVINDLHIPQSAIDVVKHEESKELLKRQKAYRGNYPFPDLKQKTIILVDDGVASGAKMRVAIMALKQLQAKKIILAIPVANEIVCEQLSKIVDEFVCPLRPAYFYATGAWYDYFTQTEDEEVYALLKQAKEMPS